MDDTLDAITRLERYYTSDFSLQRLVLVRYATPFSPLKPSFHVPATLCYVLCGVLPPFFYFLCALVFVSQKQRSRPRVPAKSFTG